MRQIAHDVDFIGFEHIAPDDIWAEVVDLFVLSFAAPPYNESPDELRSIIQWGPGKLASPGGRLVAARHGGRVIGFALSQRLDQVGQATEVREIYRHWGFSELGTSPLYDGTVTLHALHRGLPWTA